MRKAAIAAAAGVSESSVRSVLRPARPAAGGPADEAPAAGEPADTAAAGTAEARTRRAAEPDGALPVLPDPVPRDGERALARFGLLGEGAAPAFTPGARYPLAGLLLALPAAGAVPGCWPAPGRSTGGCGTGSTAWRSMLVCWCSWRCCASPAPRAPPAIPPGRAGPGAGPGPGPGSQDDPPQARRARRRRQGRGPAAGDRPPPRRGHARTSWGSSTSTGTPGRTSASGTCRRCTSPG